VINYLRGDRTKENDIIFRSRESVLGDIINSEPTYDDRGTSEVADDMIYVGANDGMLHAFSAATGNEEFAYIPAGIASTEPTKGLHYYASASYDHAAYVDMTPILTTDGTKRILLGGYGAGGKGLFALNVASSSFSTSSVLWELTAADIGTGDLGYNLSAPVIGTFKDKKVAVFGNGFQSDTGTSKLLVVNLAGPSSAGWTKDTDYYLIDAGSGGLGGVGAVFEEGSDVIKQVYAGNLEGKMYRFLKAGETVTSKVIFDAGSEQPITAKPVAKQNTNSADTPIDEFTVYFGTGAYFAEGDAAKTGVQAFYSVIDTDKTVAIANLQEVKMTTITGVAIQNARVGGDQVQRDSRIVTLGHTAVDDVQGWYGELPASAERMVLEPILLEGHVIFATTIPEDTEAVPCSDGGKGFIMILNDKTGLSPQDRPVFDLSDNFVVGDRPDDYALATSGMALPDGVNISDIIPDDSSEARVIPGGFVVNGIPTSPRYLANAANEESGTKVYYQYVNASRDPNFKLLDFGGLILKRHSWKQLQ
jgi:type IV pilus assembly protein PilY1